MEQRQKDSVFGYVRLNYNGIYPNDIIQIIFQFYLIRIHSEILNSKEQSSFLDLLYKELTKQKGKGNIKEINTKLLYRASEHDYSADVFHALCGDKGPTICIIHNEFDRVYGGYANVSWKDGQSIKDDPNAFLFSIRPSVKAYGLTEEHKNGDQVIWSYPGYGPSFGGGSDMWVSDKCNQMVIDGAQPNNGTSPISFNFKPGDLCGGTRTQGQNIHFCVVNDYEVFQISFKSCNILSNIFFYKDIIRRIFPSDQRRE